MLAFRGTAEWRQIGERCSLLEQAATQSGEGGVPAPSESTSARRS
jgi:hypothetical protein